MVLVVAPVAKLYVLAPVDAVNILTVCAAVAVLPMLNIVPAPAKLTVVAVVLTKSKLVLAVVILVVIAGLVPNTATPVPVSSLRIVANCADVNEGMSPATIVSQAGAAPLVPSPVWRKNFLVAVVFGLNRVVVLAAL